MKLHLPYTFLFLLYAVSMQAQVITTVAGNGTAAYAGDTGPATAASLHGPYCIAIDDTGNLYISDRLNNRIRKVSVATGIITTIAGTGTAGFGGDGAPAVLAQINDPNGLAVDTAGNVWFADRNNARIRVINPSGIINTVVGNGTPGHTGDGGPATGATISSPRGLACDASGNLFFADQGNNCVRKISTAGIISPVAGTGTGGFSGDGGPATVAALQGPYGVATDATGNIYIADVDNERIRKVNTAGTITTIAGTGISGFSGDGADATLAKLSEPAYICADHVGNVYIADAWNFRIRVINTSGIIYTVAGNSTAGYTGDGGSPTDASLNNPLGIALNTAGDLYIADYLNNRIRFLPHTNGIEAFIQPPSSAIVYPNPSNGQFTITAPVAGSIVHITITGSSGATVWETAAKSGDKYNVALACAPGIYLLHISSAGYQEIKKIILLN